MTIPYTLASYQQAALTTAQVRAFHNEYLVPGIVGEVGELFGQRAKAHWHQWPEAKLRQELTAEYGDICWMTALLLETYGIHNANEQVQHTTQHMSYRADPWHQLLSRAYSLNLFYSEQETQKHMPETAVQLWRTLEANCWAITGDTFQQALQVNLDKLASRASRGKLQGAGDHR